MPPPSRKKTAARNVLRFRVEGVEYAVDRDEITPRIERELYKQAGVTVNEAADALGKGAVFGVAAMMFIARRQQDEPVVYQNVEDRLWTALKNAGPDEFDLTILGDDDEVVVDPPG